MSTEFEREYPDAPGLRTVVDGDEFAKALKDPKVHQFLKDATEMVERLRREGRDHTEAGRR